MTARDANSGHTPPDPPVEVASGVGRRLAEWTIAARGGRAVAIDPADERSHRRVVAVVEALAAIEAHPADEAEDDRDDERDDEATS